MSLTVYKGRPADKRSEQEEAAYDLLDSLQIAYKRVDHAPAMTIGDCEEIDAALGVAICKNLFLCNRQKTDFYLLLMPGEKPFQTKVLSGALGVARLSFASPEHMGELLGLTPGSVTVLGLMQDADRRVQLLIDKELLKAPLFGCHPMLNTSSLVFSTEELLQKLIPALNHTPVFVDLPREEQA